MTTDIFIVTFNRDFRYLRYTLRSIARYAVGFQSTTILVPNPDLAELKELVRWSDADRVICQGFDEWPEKGMLHHMDRIMHADHHCSADLILHLDSDCVFVRPVNPGRYLVDGRPNMLYARFDWLLSERPEYAPFLRMAYRPPSAIAEHYDQAEQTAYAVDMQRWKTAVERAIGGVAAVETMRHHPMVARRSLYGTARERMERHTGLPVSAYIAAQENTFPQTFCEFNTLGNVAFQDCRSDYFWSNQQNVGLPDSHVYQAWSHREPTPQDLAVYQYLGLT